MENFNFAMLEYKRPDLEAYRTKLIAWKNEVESAKHLEVRRFRSVKLSQPVLSIWKWRRSLENSILYL